MSDQKNLNDNNIETVNIEIKELNLDLIQPNIKTFNELKQGGQKTVVIGKPGTGKTTLIKSLLYAKKHIFPVGLAMSGTEESNGEFKKIFPDSFVFNQYEEDKVKDFIERQRIARQHLENPWAVLLLDDCTDDRKIFKTPLQQGIYKRGRHWKMWYIVSLQYCLDIDPAIRTNVDGVFILRETNLKNRKSLWENYAGIIPDFNMFCSILDQITDNYTALYIHNATTSNDLSDCLYWYKAKQVPSDFKFGCNDYWKYHMARYNPEYTDNGFKK